MHKISRIRLVRVGHPQAWFEDVTIDATDPRTQAPCDTILFGANGDGKSTLIALLFSCFEPKASRFLKHLSKSSQEFHEYFGLEVGFVLVEWLRQDGGTDAAARHLLTGQAVAFRPDRPGKTERLFFAFNASAETNLDSEPFAEMHSFESLRRWTTRMDELHRNDLAFYSTQVQDDWRERLRQKVVGLDQVLLAQQVTFSVSEGGMDEIFLNFRSEDEFIGRFFDLTLNRQNGENVRDELAAYAVKHADRPDKVKRLEALTAVNPIMGQFSASATALSARRAERLAAEGRSASLGDALRVRAQQLDDQAASARECAQALAKRGAEALAAAETCDADAESLGEEILCRQAAQAAEALDRAERAARTAKIKRNSLLVAQLEARLAATEAAIAELDAAIASASAELEPLRREVAAKASRLRLSLDRAIGDAAAAKERLRLAFAAAARRAEKAPSWTDRAAKRAKDAASAKGRAEEFFRRYDLQRERLLSAVTLAPEETAEAARLRWGGAVSRHRNEADQAVSRLSAIDARTAELGKKLGDFRASEASLTTRIEAAVQFLADAETARRQLATNAALRRLLETEEGDPDDEGQFRAVDERITTLEREQHILLRRLELLGDARRTIEETELAFRDDDVRLLVDKLEEAGIGSAKAYAHYVANTVGDRLLARELVTSDPARFLGVHVQIAGELDRIRDLKELSRLPLSRPVVISLPAVTPVPIAADRLVLGPLDDSAYNRVAAQGVLDGLERDIHAADSDHDRVARELSELQGLTNERSFYLRMHGPGPRAIRSSERDHCVAERDRVAAERKTVEETIAGLEDERAEWQSAKERAEEARRDALAREESCRTFAEEYEKAHAGQQEILARATAEEASAEVWRRRWAEWGHAQTERRTDLRQETRQARTLHSNLEMEREELGEGPAEDDGSGDGLDVVRSRYRTAWEALKEREENRVDVLVARREEIAKQAKEIRTQRGQAETPWDAAEVAALVRLTAAELASHIGAAREAVAKTEEDVRKAATVDSAVKGKLDQYRTGRKYPGHRTVGIDSIASEQLEERLREARQLAESHRTEAKHHAADVKAAEKHASDTEREAEFALDKAKEIGRTLPENAVPAADRPSLPEGKPELARLVDVVLRQAAAAAGAEREAEKTAETAWEAVRGALAGIKELAKERRLAEFVAASPFEVALGEAASYCLQIEERIGVIKADLDQHEESTRILVRSLDNLLLAATRILRRASAARIPAGVPMFSGLSVLKIRFDPDTLPTGEARDESIRRFLYTIVATNLIPDSGAKVAAGLLRHMAGGADVPFGIRILKPKEGQTDSYMPIDRVTTSGGEGLTTAILLYCVLAQLRAEEADNRKSAPGGVLILDNPFAKANKTVFIQAQRQMAAAMGLQLIYATGLKDYNALGQFQRFWRLRPARRGRATGRIQVVIEPADMLIAEQPDGPERTTA